MILIVDDNEDIRTLLRIILRSAGHEVSSAEGGKEALQWLKENPTPDLIVLDVQMPYFDGWETLRAIRGHKPTEAVPVVMCTVKSRTVDQALGWDLGCDGYLTKPFDIGAIVRTLQEILARTPLERAEFRHAVRGELQEGVKS